MTATLATPAFRPTGEPALQPVSSPPTLPSPPQPPRWRLPARAFLTSSPVGLPRSLDSFPSEFGLYHSKLVIQSPADVLSDNMKRRLDPFCAPDSKNLYAPDGRFSSTSSPPLQLPIHPRPPLQSSSRVTNSPPSASLSPRSGAFPFSQHAASGSRSPLEAIDSARALRVPRKNSDGATYSVTPCFDYHGGEGMEMDDASPLKRLCIEDGQGKARRRRRITGSPLDDSALHPAAGQGDSVPPQQEFGRRSPSFARLQITSQPSSVVTARPGGPGSPNGYHMSNSSYPPWGLAATGRRSPGGYSAGESRHSSTSPYTKTVPLSTTTTVAAAVPAQCSSAHARSAPGSSPRKLAEVPKPAWTKLQGFLMCECCPKKPKKFETEEELRYGMPAPAPLSLFPPPCRRRRFSSPLASRSSWLPHLPSPAARPPASQHHSARTARTWCDV